MNRWGIPDWLEKEVKERDKFCVYCGIKMVEKMPLRGPRKNVATWEHLWIANVQAQRMSMSGFGFAGSDIGGFAEQPQGELRHG